jgi:hypothetical protein
MVARRAMSRAHLTNPDVTINRTTINVPHVVRLHLVVNARNAANVRLRANAQ